MPKSLANKKQYQRAQAQAKKNAKKLKAKAFREAKIQDRQALVTSKLEALAFKLEKLGLVEFAREIDSLANDILEGKR